MRCHLLLIITCICLLLVHSIKASQLDNNEFAEFEVSDGTGGDGVGEKEPVDDTTQHTPPPSEKAEDFFVTDNDEEEHEDEFEGEEAEVNGQKSTLSSDAEDKKVGEIKPLTFADVPSHFRTNWTNYQVEVIALVAIILYITNYLYGKTQNSTIAYNWFNTNQQTLEKHFSLVGDNGTSQEPTTGGHLMKDTDYAFSCWCTGRQGCKGMHTQLKLNKRQDLLGLLLNIFWPKQDHVVHTIELDKGEMDSFVLIFGKRKGVLKEVKELNDLGTYATERKLVDKLGLPSNFAVFAEISESLSSILDTATIQFINQHEKSFEYMHVSDQFSGARPTEETASKLADTRPVLIFSYSLFESGKSDEEMVLFLFHMLERIRRYRLSKEGKNKADKKRQEVEENFIRATHQQRQEAAMARREEKTRERKQRVMEEEDPDKQMRLQKVEAKRDAKLRQPRMKQFKMK